jgi:hypothetical protein
MGALDRRRDRHRGVSEPSNRAARALRPLAAAAVALAVAGAASAQTGEAEPGAQPSPSGAPGSVDLDRLLKLPDSYDAGAVEEKKGGATASEWRKRFARARGDLVEAEEVLAQTQLELENAASESGNYQVNAPGVQNPEASPVSFSLRQKLKEQRSAVEESKKALRQLEIEADLAEVPRGWRGVEAAADATIRSSQKAGSGLAPPESSP